MQVNRSADEPQNIYLSGATHDGRSSAESLQMEKKAILAIVHHGKTSKCPHSVILAPAMRLLAKR